MNSAKRHILIVDDESQIRDVIAAIVDLEGYSYSLAENAESAYEQLHQQNVDLLISDINMQGMDGMELLEIALKSFPDLAVIMVTGVDDRETAIKTLQMGAYGYVTKPFQANELIINISSALRRRQLELENRRHREELEILVKERTAELFKSREESIHILSKAGEFRDDETAKHTIRMGRFSGKLAVLCGLSDKMAKNIRYAAPLHDVGKIGISDTILLKPGKLTYEEFEIMKTHAEIGYRILSESTSDVLSLGAEIALNHHEKFDGSGYPRGLIGDDIPISGRIAAVCDVFDALTSKRVYKEAMPIEKALDILKEGRENHFDPQVLDNFLANFDYFAHIKERFSD